MTYRVIMLHAGNYVIEATAWDGSTSYLPGSYSEPSEAFAALRNL